VKLVKNCNKCNRQLQESNFYKDKTKKDGLSTCCIDCRKQWKKDNKAHIADYNFTYQKEHLLESRERKNRQRKNNLELHNQKHREWLNKNPSKKDEYYKNDYAKNKNSYKMRAVLRKRRISAIENDYSLKEWEETLEYFNYECAYCGSKQNLQQEHILPVVKQGRYVKNNIIPACKKCNSSKWANSLMGWYLCKDFFDKNRLHKIVMFISEYANQSGRLNITI